MIITETYRRNVGQEYFLNTRVYIFFLDYVILKIIDAIEFLFGLKGLRQWPLAFFHNVAKIHVCGEKFTIDKKNEFSR